MDFFTVPTLNLKLLYGFFVIEPSRRRILHFNVTSHPNSEWVVQQLREAFPETGPYRYLILNRDSLTARCVRVLGSAVFIAGMAGRKLPSELAKLKAFRTCALAAYSASESSARP